MKNLLVTGGAGFIGSNFVHYVLAYEPDLTIVNLDKLTYAGNLHNLDGLQDHPRHIFIHGDICDQALIRKALREYAIDTIVHFAAESHVDRSITGPTAFVQTNIVGTFTLLEEARQFWLVESNIPPEKIRFHHVSTDEVYGSLAPDDPPFSETTPYAPNSPYAASKAASDHLVRAYAHTYNLPVTITNCSNNYGPRQFPEKLIPLLILNCLAGKTLPVYGDGRQIRDWLYVEDHCAAILQVLKSNRVGETYNIGGNNQPTNLEVIQTICKIMDERLPDSPHYPHEQLIAFVTDRPGHDRRYAMDIRKIASQLNWQPHQSLATGLQQTVDWYLNHPDWIAAIRERRDYSEWLDINYSKRGKNP